MKWKNGRQGGNVQVDCLGLRADLGSPEADAAFACQEEVNKIRDDMVKSMSASHLLRVGNHDPGTRKAELEELADFSMRVQMRDFLQDKKERPYPLKLSDRLTGKDTFQGRLKDFKDQVYIPGTAFIPHLY